MTTRSTIHGFSPPIGPEVFWVLAFVVLLALAEHVARGQVSDQTKPEIWRAHFIPGEEPSLILTGKNLWIGSCHDAVNQIRPNGASNVVYVDGSIGEWDALYGATGNDQNLALPWVQRVKLHPNTAAKLESAPLDGGLWTSLALIRRDRQVAISSVTLPLNRGRWEAIGSTTSSGPTIREITEPIVVNDQETKDFGGTLYLPAPTFKGNEMVRYGKMCTLRNGRFLIPESSRSGPTAVFRAINGVTDRVHIDAVDIAHLKPNGQGIACRSITTSFIGHSKIVADRCFYTEPADKSENNVFYEISFGGRRGEYDSQIGGGLDGRRNLVWRCRWHEIDRGPTGPCFGSPLEQTVWFECSQYRTGWNQGAGEGKLTESVESIEVSAQINGKEIVATSPDVVSVGIAIFQVRPGFFVATKTIDPAPTRWARIVTVNRVPGEPTFRLQVDREIGNGSATIRIGNAVVENVIARSRFDTGKAGIFLFGATYDTVIVQNQFHNLLGGIVRLETSRPHGSAWHVGIVDRGNFFRFVDEPRVTIPNTRDWPKPGALP